MFITVHWGRQDVTTSNWNKVVELLNDAKDKGGIIRLSSGKDVLSLRMDEIQGLYLPILNPYFEHEVQLRFYHTPEKEMKLVDHDGDMEYDALLTDDFDLILKLAREFYDTGTVKCMQPEKDLPPPIDDEVEGS